MNSTLIILASLTLVVSLLAARRSSKTIRTIKGIFPGYKMLAVCIIFMLTLLVLSEALLVKVAGTSFYHLLGKSPRIPLETAGLGILLGTVYEYIGCVALDLWYYPPVVLKRWLFLTLPLAYGLFIFIMQDTFAVLRHWHFDTVGALFVTSAVQMVLIEGINLYTKSWIYKGPFRNVLVLFGGWLLLTYSFVVMVNAYLLNPLGV